MGFMPQENNTTSKMFIAHLFKYKEFLKYNQVGTIFFEKSEL
jgi:hypothetical protein